MDEVNRGGKPWRDVGRRFATYSDMQRQIDENVSNVNHWGREGVYYLNTKDKREPGEVCIGLHTWEEGPLEEEVAKVQSELDEEYGPGNVVVRLDPRINRQILTKKGESQTFGLISSIRCDDDAQVAGIFIKRA